MGTNSTHTVYLLVELRITASTEDEEASRIAETYVGKNLTMSDVLDLSGDLTRDLDRDIEESLEHGWYTLDDVQVHASALGLLKTMPRAKLY